MIDSYLTLIRESSDEIVINKSRFIGYARPVSTEEEAQAFLRAIREKHRDASHNCYAYVIGLNSGIMRYSDDGEPGGTAGLPIIELIKAKQIVNCCVVVTRYFGGVLLGTGGLVRAYTQGCRIALEAAGIVRMENTAHLLCEVPYPDWDRVQYLMKSRPVLLSDTAYGTGVTFTVNVRVPDQEEVTRDLVSATDGRVEIMEDEPSFFAWPVQTETETA